MFKSCPDTMMGAAKPKPQPDLQMLILSSRQSILQRPSTARPKQTWRNVGTAKGSKLFDDASQGLLGVGEQRDTRYTERLVRQGTQGTSWNTQVVGIFSNLPAR